MKNSLKETIKIYEPHLILTKILSAAKYFSEKFSTTETKS